LRSRFPNRRECGVVNVALRFCALTPAQGFGALVLRPIIQPTLLLMLNRRHDFCHGCQIAA
jgi:hypothetical protein